MRAHLLWREGVFTLLERDPSVGFIAAGTYIPATNVAGSGGFAAQPGSLVVRMPIVGRVMRRLSRLRWCTPPAFHGLLLGKTAAARRKREATAVRLIALATGALANAGEGVPPQASLYPGYDFSSPFPLARFLEAQVPEAVLYAPASAFSIADAPHALFLRSPAVGVSEEVLYLAVVGGQPHTVETIHLSEAGGGLRAAPTPVKCDFGSLHAVDPARFLRVTLESVPKGRHAGFTFLSARNSGPALCQQAALTIGGLR